jgi:hypothetical protein
MRYAKGSLVVSGERDIPLLRLVRNSRFITHDQLFEFMKLGGFDHDRNAFNWRLKRLRDSGYVSSCAEIHGAGSAVYRITKNGVTLLEHHGQFTTVMNSKTEHLPHLVQAFHAIELNSVHLTLARHNLVASWQTEVEIASFNTTSHSPFCKDYDAVVDVWLGDRKARFALEYERTLKSLTHYRRIRDLLELEQEVKCILYLTSGTELLGPLVQEFGSVRKNLAFATAGSFKQDLLDTAVLLGNGLLAARFRDLLQ